MLNIRKCGQVWRSWNGLKFLFPAFSRKINFHHPFTALKVFKNNLKRYQLFIAVNQKDYFKI